MATTLVIRLSSLGDVAMTIPILYSVANRYPDDAFLLLTKKPLQPLFINKPANLEIFPVDAKGEHKGMKGLWRLICNLPQVEGLYIADLHNVLRSKIIDCYFRLKGAKIAVINKGRKEKKTLTQRNNKKLVPLKSSFKRYQEVFEHLGYDASVDFTSLFPDKKKKEETWIGIAPFAKHENKTYPLEKIEEVVRSLNSRPHTKIFLFGGKDETKLLTEWEKKYDNVESVAGKLFFQGELSLMNDLDVMVSMDSANMHLASLANTSVVSVWGATHPYAGFYGFNQDPENAVQVEMGCRPCSIYGNKPCYRGDFACMKGITPEMIVEKIREVLGY
jgi:ADP-heptose:LPS heptosyltransferase